MSRKGAELSRVNPHGLDACNRLLEFALQGKMIRGCLVSVGYSLCAHGDTDDVPRECIKAGAAMELFQSGLLVHDDVMDRDLTRRGNPTIFQQYVREAEKEGVADSYHLGESLGNCVGDVAYFLAFDLLAGMEINPHVLSRILALCARELAAVGVAQIQDVAWGPASAPVAREDILRLYTYKTGRYTFSLPLMLGGILVGAPPADLGAYEELGEHLGVAFQIRDDELNLFGDERETGKPVGSDIREGKKTLFASELMARAGAAEARRLSGILGNPGVSPEDVGYVQSLMESLGVRDAVHRIAEDHGNRARRLADGLGGGTGALGGLLDYTLTRTR